MWEVIGFESQRDDEGNVTAYTMYATKSFKGEKGAGKKARRVWYRTEEIDYKPVVGDVVVIETETRGKYEVVTDIWVA